MNVVCDTNVLVSAVLFGGQPREVLRRIAEGNAIGYTSPDLKRELADVLAREKFGLSSEQVSSILQLIGETFIEVVPDEVPDVIRDDPDDNVVLACAVAANAQWIVSGDRHLLDLKSYQETTILSPVDALTQWK